MSFDVFFQGFHQTGAATGGGDTFQRGLSAHLEQSASGGWLLKTDDGGAEMSLRPDGAMASHVAGRTAWDLLVEAARAADWVILWPGGVCPTNAGQREHLPPQLRGSAVLVSSGHELRAVIDASR